MSGEQPQLYFVVLMTTAFESLDEVQERAPRELAEHLRRSRELYESGDLVMAGAFLDRPDQPVETMGVLCTLEAAQDYASHDPFVVAGFVVEQTIRSWANMLR